MKTLILVVNIVAIYISQCSTKNFEVYYNNISSYTNPEYGHSSVEVHENKLITIRGESTKKIDDLFIKVELSLGNPLVMVFNKTAYLCKYLEKKNNDPLVNIIFKEMLKVFKLTKCPFPKGTPFVAVNYTIDLEKIPRFFPTSAYLSITEFYLYEKLKRVIFFKSSFEGTIVNLNPIRMKNVFNPSEMFG